MYIDNERRGGNECVCALDKVTQNNKTDGMGSGQKDNKEADSERTKDWERLGKQTNAQAKDNGSDTCNDGGGAALDHAHRTVAARAARAASGTREGSICRASGSLSRRAVRVSVGVGCNLSRLSAVGSHLKRARRCSSSSTERDQGQGLVSIHPDPRQDCVSALTVVHLGVCCRRMRASKIMTTGLDQLLLPLKSNLDSLVHHSRSSS